jgi:Alpha-glutamyl/putrescinyl thymine pyrophosphorylase clade 3
MKSVVSFGRTARFDYLTMIGKLGLASIEPGFAYMGGATGPLRGARLLFFGSATAGGVTPRQLDAWLAELDAYLGVGMQVLEDSLCNWQKSPGRFLRFRG